MASRWGSMFAVGLLCSRCMMMPEVDARDRGDCDHTVRFAIDGVSVYDDRSGHALLFEAGLMVNADGAPDAYHPANKGTDNLRNAGRRGNWWGIATDSGKPSGKPFVQGKGDPFPGYYVSQTALFNPLKDRDDPARYVNANDIPYMVLSGGKSWGVELGDLAIVINRKTGDFAAAVVAEFGPATSIGEGSIALAEALGIDSSPRTGGVESDVAYVVFPGTGSGFPESKRSIERNAKALFARWGGIAHANECLN